jgi:hypothetical protein
MIINRIGLFEGAGIVQRYDLDGLGLIPDNAIFFSLYFTASRPALGPSLLSNGYRG